jgi:hypothetical protein
VIEVLVLFVLDFFVRFLERPGDVALGFLYHFTDQLPVQVVLGLGEHDTFRCDQLRRAWFALGQCHLHRLNQRFADVAHHLGQIVQARRLLGAWT